MVVGLKKEGTYNECDSENVTSDDYPATNVDETDSDHQEDGNLSCRLENEITNEDNSSTVDSSLGLAINKTLDILGQERNYFWCPPDYILDSYKKISNIHLKDDIIK